jgi:hypothetical protein
MINQSIDWDYVFVSLLELKRAWEIIEKNKERVDPSKLIESILNLKPKVSIGVNL